MVARNTPSMILGSAWLILLCWCSVWCVVDAYSTSRLNFERYLPEDDSSDNGSYDTKKSKKGYYDYYGAKGSKSAYYSKSDKKSKDCKSAKKKSNDNGYYDQ